MKKSERLKEESKTLRKAKLEIEKKQKRRENFKKIFAIALVPLVFGAGLATGNLMGSDSQGRSGIESRNITIEKVERSISGKSSEEDRRDAFEALRNTLTSAGKSKGNLDFETRLTKLDSGDYSDVDKELLDSMRWTDGLDKRKAVKQNAVQGFVTLNYIITESGNRKIEPKSDVDINQAIYLDQETGRAFIPISIFLGPSNSMSVEMIYDSESKEWKVDPYSFVESLRLSASLQQSQQSQTQQNNPQKQG